MTSNKWVTFVHENVSYMVNICNSGDDLLKCILTNMKTAWMENLRADQLHQRFKDLNKSFNLDIEESKKQVVFLVEGIQGNTKLIIEKNSNEILFKLKGQISDFFIVYEFHLVLCDSETFFTEITLPLMKTAQLLEEQRNSLCNLLLQKDKEINEYMMEKGATISKKYLITEPFSRSEFDKIASGNLLLGIFEKSNRFWMQLCGKEDVEPQPKRVKPSQSGEKVRVYSSKSKKSPSKGLKYNCDK